MLNETLRRGRDLFLSLSLGLRIFVALYFSLSELSSIYFARSAKITGNAFASCRRFHTCRSLLYNLLLDESPHAGGRSLQGRPDDLLLLALLIFRVLKHKDEISMHTMYPARYSMKSVFPINDLELG